MIEGRDNNTQRRFVRLLLIRLGVLALVLAVLCILVLLIIPGHWLYRIPSHQVADREARMSLERLVTPVERLGNEVLDKDAQKKH